MATGRPAWLQAIFNSVTWTHVLDSSSLTVLLNKNYLLIAEKPFTLQPTSPEMTLQFLIKTRDDSSEIGILHYAWVLICRERACDSTGCLVKFVCMQERGGLF